MAGDVLERFSPATAAWFRGSFSAPTPAQEGAWSAISSGHHALVVAPTGSGKTLSAFLWALDRLASGEPPASPQQRCRVLYVSPLKALAVDVERNLRSPLVGIGHAAARLGLPAPDITVAVRSGDTPAADRRAFIRTPSDILITTPESLFLMLTSSAREALTGVETVIVDEVHAVAGTKRGAHLALSLERLDQLLPKPAQRVGLSATVRPVEEVARYLSGGRPVEIVQPPSTKEWDLEVVVPLADMSALGELTEDLSGPAAGEQRRASIWPHVEERIVDLVSAHRSTLVFANSRRLAERLTARLNEIWEERLTAADEAAEAADSTNAADSTQDGRSGGAARTERCGPAYAISGRDHGAVGGVVRRSPHPGPGPPRLGEQGAARRDRERAQGRPAPGGGRHEQPRARHRHGRRRPRRPGGVAAQRRQRSAAGRPRRAPGGGGLARRAVPEVPGRPRADRRRRRAHAGRCDRVDAPADEPARRARAADRRHVRDGRLVGRRRRGSGPTVGAVRRTVPVGARVGARHAGGALPERRVRRAAAAAGVGPRDRHADRTARGAATGRDLGRDDPRPRPLRGVPGRIGRSGSPGRRARRGDGLRVAGR